MDILKGVDAMNKIGVAVGEDGKLVVFAWPGGYPIVYVDGNSEILCPACAQSAMDDPDGFEDWKPRLFFIHYEGPSMYCSECNAEIESAYGDPFSEGAE